MDNEQRQFVSEISALLQATTPGRSFDVDEAGFSIRYADGAQLNLANLYLAWRDGDPDLRQQLLKNAIVTPRTAAAALPQTFAEASPSLLPRVRDLASRSLNLLDAETRG